MTSAMIVERLIGVGFSFTLAEDGSVSFHRPAADTAETDDLCAILAWRLGDLEPAIIDYLNTIPSKGTS